MSCTIRIDEVRGQVDSTGALTGIEVVGSAEGCVQIGLTLRCIDPRVGGSVETTYTVDPTPGETRWKALVTPPDCAACGREITVDARCLSEGDVVHPDCDPAVVTEPLACENCPRIAVERSVSDSCEGGRRAVTHRVVVDAPPGEIVETRLHYGDGTSAGTTTERRFSRTRMYDPTVGFVNPWVEIVRPEGCPDAELPGFRLEPCPEEDEGESGPRCPGIHSVTPGPVHAARNGCQLVWSVNHTSPPRPGTYTWKFDGSDETVTTREPFITRAYSESGRHSADVRYEPDDPECPLVRMTGAVELEGWERGGGGEGGGCIILREVATIALAIAMALFIFSVCATDPNLANAARITAAASSILGLLILTLWILFCADKPCKPGLLLSGLAILGAGYALLHISACCPALVAGAPAAIAGGAGILLGWRAACDISWCSFFKEIAVFTTGILAVIIALLVVFLPGCLPTFSQEAIAGTMLVAFDLAFAGVAYRALRCDGRIGDREELAEPRIRDEVPPPIDE